MKAPFRECTISSLWRLYRQHCEPQSNPPLGMGLQGYFMGFIYCFPGVPSAVGMEPRAAPPHSFFHSSPLVWHFWKKTADKDGVCNSSMKRDTGMSVHWCITRTGCHPVCGCLGTLACSQLVLGSSAHPSCSGSTNLMAPGSSCLPPHMDKEQVSGSVPLNKFCLGL